MYVLIEASQLLPLGSKKKTFKRHIYVTYWFLGSFRGHVNNYATGMERSLNRPFCDKQIKGIRDVILITAVCIDLANSKQKVLHTWW